MLEQKKAAGLVRHTQEQESLAGKEPMLEQVRCQDPEGPTLGQFLEDCAPWKGPTQWQLLKNCSPGKEQFGKDHIPWE